ncbi:MAG TPA: sulfatase [Vicinamibacteria bacterium]|nr:sulfatase [Vicinamibacteria bacterium]
MPYQILLISRLMGGDSLGLRVVSPSGYRAGWTFWLFLVTTLLTGCGSDGSRRLGESVQRFISNSPQELFDPTSLLDYQSVFSWKFQQPRDLESWLPSGLDSRFELEGPGLWIQSRGTKLQLSRKVDFEAEAIDQIELVATELLVQSVSLEWAEPDGDFEPDRRVMIPARDIQRNELQSARFWLKGNAHWAGHIGRLRFTIHARPERPIQLHEIRGVSAKSSGIRLAEAVSRPWLVDLGGEVRSSLLQLPGQPLEMELEVPRGAEFRFAYGMPASVEHPVRFRVSINPRKGEPQTLFEDTVRRGRQGWGSWNEMVLDLSPYGGTVIKISLDTSADRTLDTMYGVPAWGNPEVIGALENKPPNVVLISIDTLRADHMSLYGYERDTTPAIDAWARRFGTQFENVVASSPWTLPSHASLFTGLNAHRHGVNHQLPAPASLTTLAEELRRAGYLSVAVTGGGYLHPRYGLAQGFDLYRYWTGESSGQELESGIQASLDFLEKHQERPFFLFFHTFEVHTPYRPRQPHFTRLSGLPEGREVIMRQRPGLDPVRRLNQNYFAARSTDGSGNSTPLDEKDLPLVRAHYDAGIAYTDQQLGRLLNKLSAANVEPLVVLTSDHGEMLGEHGLAGHYTLYEENLMVPLIIQFPGGRGAGTVVRRQTSLVDVTPTILDALGLEPLPGIDGSSLLSVSAGEENGRNIAWSYAAQGDHGLALRIDNRLKFIFRNSVFPEVRGFDELYRLDVDPDENENLVSDDKASSDLLRREARRVLQGDSPGLRVRIENHGATIFQSTLEGSVVTRAGLKSDDIACPCVIWQGSNRADLSVPPGEAFTLVLEGSLGRYLRLTPAMGKKDPIVLDIMTLEGKTAFACSDSSCTEAACTETAPCITVWRAGEHRMEETLWRPDDDLEKQLRALGYVQ